MLNNRTGVTKKTFLKWLEKGRKGLLVSELLREIEKKYKELSVRD